MLIDYLDQISVIHLPGRRDRHALMAREFAAIGLPLGHPKVDIPHAPWSISNGRIAISFTSARSIA